MIEALCTAISVFLSVCLSVSKSIRNKVYRCLMALLLQLLCFLYGCSQEFLLNGEDPCRAPQCDIYKRKKFVPETPVKVLNH